MRFGIFLGFFLLLGGCASMSESACLEGRWNDKGYQDANNGSISRIGSYQKACSEHGVEADEKAYSAGYRKGLSDFCTYKMGYNFGLNQRTYSNTCPRELESEFFKGYTMGEQQASLDRAEEERQEERERREESSN